MQIRTVEHVNKEIREAKSKLLLWETRVKELEKERQEKINQL